MPKEYHLLDNNCQDFAVHLLLRFCCSAELLKKLRSYLSIEKTSGFDLNEYETQQSWGYHFEVKGKFTNFHIASLFVSIKELYHSSLLESWIDPTITVKEKVLKDNDFVLVTKYDVFDAGKYIWSWTEEKQRDAEWWERKRWQDDRARDRNDFRLEMSSFMRGVERPMMPW